MKRGRTYLYITLIILAVVGTVGGAMYWRANNQEFRTQQAAKRANRRRQEQQLSSTAKKREASTQKSAPRQIQHKTTQQTKQITSYLKRNHFVGSAIIVKNNHILYQQGFGYANYKSDIPNTPSSEFQILSIQKSLTAVMAMKLITQGKLSLNTQAVEVLSKDCQFPEHHHPQSNGYGFRFDDE